VKIQTASTAAMNIRESPGIITIVTREEIANSGARDLIDVLRLVPGFEFCQDYSGIISLGFRGIWALLDGKALLLIDEQEYNEMFWGSINFGNSFSVDQIDRIEIIRGPGSAKYGGHAGLAVIKIVTKGTELKGLNASIMHGQQQELNSRNQANVSFGNKFGDLGLSMSACLKTGDGTSTRDYTDFYGGSYSLEDNSAYDQLDFNLGLNYKDLDLRFIVDRN
ncbi:MAG: TonB-dependent receptor plug domain-containing protein, partial [Planctomycetes bacterium]|nr:TonB-dependent receptor plug domain-containing protein [Planctomycetota bacterium]